MEPTSQGMLQEIAKACLKVMRAAAKYVMFFLTVFAFLTDLNFAGAQYFKGVGQ